MPNDKPDQPNPAAPSTPPAANGEPESLDSLDTPAAPPVQTTVPQNNTPKPPKKGVRGRFSIFNNLYLIIFGLLVLIGAAVIMVSLKASTPPVKTSKATSLTDQQIASLKGNTTLVGDSKQTLDVQSNSIFENQVLLRSDLNVAGSLKVGGPISIPSITVGGTGTFGQLGVNGGLNVGGDTTLQGQLTVQKNLSVTGSASFGSLNVSSLSVTSLLLRGDININQHIISSGGVPSRFNGTALGSGGTATVSGSDTAGTVAINTGGGPPAGCFVTVNFTKNYSATPHVVISPSNSSAATLQYYTNRSSTNFSVCTASAPAGGTSYNFDYIVIN
jgi:hypothetical protein